MGYLTQQLEKVAEATIEKTRLGVPYAKPATKANESSKYDIGTLLGAGVAGGGLGAGKFIGDAALHKKVLLDKAFEEAVAKDHAKAYEKLYELTGGRKGWLNKLSWRSVPGYDKYIPSALGHAVNAGISYGSFFKNLKLPGKLKALGLIAAPLAAGGLVDAAID